MRMAIPEECYLKVPAQITPELARSCADKIDLLFQAQLLARNVHELDSALSLLLDLAGDLVPHDKAALFWRDDPEGTLQVRIHRGFGDDVPISGLRDCVQGRDAVSNHRLFLIPSPDCPSPPLGHLLQKLGAVSLLHLPLYVGETVMGSLVLMRTTAGPLRVEDAHLLRVFTFIFESVLDGLNRGTPRKDYAFADGSTGLFNQRYFEQQLEREIDRARRNNEPLSVVFLELDGFPAFRTRHGRAAGEALLHEVAKILRQVCRKSDTLARCEDDAFSVILPRTAKETLTVVARRVFDGLQGPFLSGLMENAGSGVVFNLSAVAYPEDAFSAESILEAGHQGLAEARKKPGRHYYQFPSHKTRGEEEELLDAVRAGLFREPLLEPSRLLQLFARLCLDAVPADRVSIMVREADSLVIQVALGFEGQEEIVKGTRVPLTGRAVSSWVAQNREPLLVRGPEGLSGLSRSGGAAYHADSFFSYPLLENGDLLGVIHFSNRSDGNPFTDQDVEAFQPLARVMSGYLALGQRFGRAQEEFLQKALFALVDLMERQVPGMAHHSEEVARLAEATARQLGYGEEAIGGLTVTARLHDLGKVGYRARVLAEPRALSPRERAIAQRHPLMGWKFLETMPMGRIDREAILYHHEREDGSGYFGKTGPDTPESAKILAVVDVFQALTSPRAYRPAVSLDAGLTYLDQHKGTLFDPRVVDALTAAIRGTG